MSSTGAKEGEIFDTSSSAGSYYYLIIHSTHLILIAKQEVNTNGNKDKTPSSAPPAAGMASVPSFIFLCGF